ncbi:MAG: MarR family transcriptional regulator [Deltaproteobacteria bacterium]|nr:MarR family transcriptional regulator [Deltaproteobacteria bacterium]
MNAQSLPITLTQMRILSLFTEQDIIHISEASRRLGMTIQSVNNIIRRLEDAGYVSRTPNKDNKRFSDISLTAKGKKRFTAFRSSQVNTLSPVLDRLTQKEQTRLFTALQDAASILDKTEQ